MSLFGSLFTGVSGIGAQSEATSMIANNIANVSTVGFKRSEASFYSLVTSASRQSSYSPGTVKTTRVQRVDLQGSIQQTSSSTDAAISGNGFYVVKRDASSDQPYLYTRSGSFSEDDNGILRNTAGFVLYAWPLDANGHLPSNQGDLASLVPVNVAFLGGLTRPTTHADIALNLNADEIDNVTELYGTPQTLPIGTGTVHANFTRSVTMYDSLGSEQPLTFEFRKIAGPEAHVTTQKIGLDLSTSLTDPVQFGGMAAGDAFTVNLTSSQFGSISQQFVIGAAATPPAVRVDTVSDLITNLNALGPGAFHAALDESGRLSIRSVDPAASFTFTEDTGNPLTDPGTLTIADQPGNAALQYTAQANLLPPFSSGSTYPDQGDFPSFSNTTNPNTEGWWEVTVVKPDGSTQTQGLINFDGSGKLNATPDADGNIDINLANIDWNNGSDLQDINVDISKFSQFAGQYDVISSDQNGAALGLRTGVEITRDGLVVAQFSNGATADLYKIPLGTFANPNGLQEESGTAYSETDGSGAINLREPGAGGAGFLEPSTVEGSNVDLADEFAKLIVAQRAFTANTKIITTVDQMAEDLLRLR